MNKLIAAWRARAGSHLRKVQRAQEHKLGQESVNSPKRRAPRERGDFGLEPASPTSTPLPTFFTSSWKATSRSYPHAPWSSIPAKASSSMLLRLSGVPRTPTPSPSPSMSRALVRPTSASPRGGSKSLQPSTDVGKTCFTWPRDVLKNALKVRVRVRCQEHAKGRCPNNLHHEPSAWAPPSFTPHSRETPSWC